MSAVSALCDKIKYRVYCEDVKVDAFLETAASQALGVPQMTSHLGSGEETTTSRPSTAPPDSRQTGNRTSHRSLRHSHLGRKCIPPPSHPSQTRSETQAPRSHAPPHPGSTASYSSRTRARGPSCGAQGRRTGCGSRWCAGTPGLRRRPPRARRPQRDTSMPRHTQYAPRRAGARSRRPGASSRLKRRR